MFWTIVGAILLAYFLISAINAVSENLHRQDQWEKHWRRVWAAHDAERDRARGFCPGEREWLQRHARELAGEVSDEWTPASIATVTVALLVVVVMALFYEPAPRPAVTQQYQPPTTEQIVISWVIFGSGLSIIGGLLYRRLRRHQRRDHERARQYARIAESMAREEAERTT
jgi:hypothetical protein